MMTHLLCAGALALALLTCAPALAQHATNSAAPAGYAPESACLTWSGGAVGVGTLVPCGSVPSVPAGTAFTATTLTLTAGQAAGTAPILAANAARRALVITPPADCQLTAASGATVGWKLFGALDRSWAGAGTPTGALYVSGLVAGQTLTILEG